MRLCFELPTIPSVGITYPKEYQVCLSSRHVLAHVGLIELVMDPPSWGERVSLGESSEPGYAKLIGSIVLDSGAELLSDYSTNIVVTVANIHPVEGSIQKAVKVATLSLLVFVHALPVVLGIS